MGFAIGYRTTEELSPALQREVIASLEQQSAGRTWLSCEPPILLDDGGCLRGSSKPNFYPHADDVASARSHELPDGTVKDLLDCLCRVSAEFDIDWEIVHDYSDGPVGYIHCGACDDEVRTQCEAFADLADDLRDEGINLEDLFGGDGM